MGLSSLIKSDAVLRGKEGDQEDDDSRNWHFRWPALAFTNGILIQTGVEGAPELSL